MEEPSPSWVTRTWEVRGIMLGENLKQELLATEIWFNELRLWRTWMRRRD